METKTQLQVHKPEATPSNLPAGIDKAIAYAICERPIRQWIAEEMEFLVFRLSDIFDKAFLKLGHKDEGGVMRSMIIDDLLSNKLIHGLSPKDIEIAIDRGLHGNYQTDFVTLNVLVVNLFIIAYKGQRIEVNKQLEQVRKHEEEKVAESPVELAVKCENAYNKLLRYMDDYKKIPGMWWPVLVFFHLENLGEIKQTVEEKREYVRLVYSELIDAANTAKIKQKQSEYKRIKGIAENADLLANECRERQATEWAQMYLAGK